MPVIEGVRQCFKLILVKSSMKGLPNYEQLCAREFTYVSPMDSIQTRRVNKSGSKGVFLTPSLVLFFVNMYKHKMCKRQNSKLQVAANAT